MSMWKIDVEGVFERNVKRFPQYEQAVLFAAVEHVLKPMGTDVCSTEWGKNLGQGLYEFRIRKSLNAILEEFARVEEDYVHPAGSGRQVLLRAFFVVSGRQIILLLSAYDKRKDPSPKRQRREIARARKQQRALGRKGKKKT